MDVVESWAVGRGFGGELEYGAMYAPKDTDAYATYMHAPLRRKIDEVGLPLVQNMISQELGDSMDPAAGERIREIHANRFPNDAELRELVENLGSYEGGGAPQPGTTTSASSPGNDPRHPSRNHMPRPDDPGQRRRCSSSPWPPVACALAVADHSGCSPPCRPSSTRRSSRARS